MTPVAREPDQEVRTGEYKRTNRGTVSAIIINYESGESLTDCVRTLRQQPHILEIIIVDNGSRDGSVDVVSNSFPDLNVVCPRTNLGFAGGANAGALVARGDLLLFLNPDIELTGSALTGLVAAFEDASVGVAGPPLDVVTSKVIEYGATLDPIGSPIGIKTPVPPLYVPGCALMTRAALFGELQGFDERYFMFVEDVDYCWRVLLAGLDVRVASCDPVRHIGGAATPGGYLTPHGVLSTRFRVGLRERNTLTTLMKCYGPLLVTLVTPCYIIQSLLTAGLLAATGQRRTAADIVAGLTWNLLNMSDTCERRRTVQNSRQVSDLRIVSRMYRGLWKVTLLTRFGIPAITEADQPRGVV